MKVLVILFAAFVCVMPTSAFAQSSSESGYLVDSKCYDAIERDVSPFAISIYLARDKDQEIRLCTPNSKTKSFAVVGGPDNLTIFKLDPIGNELAVAFVRKFGKKSFRQVTVVGEKHYDTIVVNTISNAK